MTAQTALADGKLSEAIELQYEAVREQPSDTSTRLFLFELLILSGRLDDARRELMLLNPDDTGWIDAKRGFEELLYAESRRVPLLRQPRFLMAPSKHAKRRWNAALCHRCAQYPRAIRWLDAADAVTPEVSGYINGRDFTGIRDSDERFASILEAFIGKHYVWIPFEQIVKLRLEEPKLVLDIAYRRGSVLLADGRDYLITVPLLYPGSALQGDDFALGNLADWTGEDAGLVRGLGAKILSCGDEEVSLADTRMIEFKPIT